MTIVRREQLAELNLADNQVRILVLEESPPWSIETDWHMGDIVATPSGIPWEYRGAALAAAGHTTIFSPTS